MPGFDPKNFLQRVGSGKTITRRLAGTVVFKQGDHADHVFYLQSGRAKETVTSDQGKEATVGVLDAGHFFGTSAFDGGIIRLSTVVTVTECTITEITKTAMTRALKEPRFAQLFVAYLLHHNSKIEAEKIDLLFNNTEKRLAQRLLILAHVGDGAPQMIGPEITQPMLATMVGCTRPAVNKFLVKFRRLGFIKYDDFLGIEVLPTLLKAVLQDGKEDHEE